MIKTLAEGYLLFLEPQNKATESFIDEYVVKMQVMLDESKQGIDIEGATLERREEADKRDIEEYGRTYSGIESRAKYKGGVFEMGPGAQWRGFHCCTACAKVYSENYDFLIEHEDPNKSVVTNSLCLHYLMCHRDEVPEDQLEFIDNFTSDALLTKIYEGRGVIAINDYALEKIKEGMEKNE
tara:strand:+ start:11970 stop:12515 length:546 start_codon:yes stop_codon:yes gene_type:complete